MSGTVLLIGGWTATVQAGSYGRRDIYSLEDGGEWRHEARLRVERSSTCVVGYEGAAVVIGNARCNPDQTNLTR